MEQDLTSPKPAEVPPASEGRPARLWTWLKSATMSLLTYFKKRPLVISHYMQTIAVVFGVISAWYTFIYTEKIKPAHEQPMILLTATLEKEGRKPIPEQEGTVTMIAVRAAVNVQNTSKTRVTVVSAYFNVRGNNVEPGQDEGKSAYSDYVMKELAAKSNESKDTIVSRYDPLKGSEVIHSSNLMQGGWALDPGEQYSRSTIFYIPKGKYDFLTITFDVFVAKNPQYEEKLKMKWEAKDGELHSNFFVRRDEVPCDESDPARNCDPYNPKNKSHVQIKERYGVVHNDAISALSLWER